MTKKKKKKKKKECCLLLFFNNCVYLFIFGCAESSLLCGLFLVWRGGLPSSLSVQASHCSGFSCCGERALGCSGFSSLANGLSSCSSQAQWLWHTGLVALWHVGSSQTKNRTCVSCIGRLFTTEPPRKPKCDLPKGRHFVHDCFLSVWNQAWS